MSLTVTSSLDRTLKLTENRPTQRDKVIYSSTPDLSLGILKFKRLAYRLLLHRSNSRIEVFKLAKSSEKCVASNHNSDSEDDDEEENGALSNEPTRIGCIFSDLKDDIIASEISRDGKHI